MASSFWWIDRICLFLKLSSYQQNRDSHIDREQADSWGEGLGEGWGRGSDKQKKKKKEKELMDMDCRVVIVGVEGGWGEVVEDIE